MPMVDDSKMWPLLKILGTQNHLIKLLISLKQSSFLNDVTYKLYYLVLEKAQELLLMWMVF
jgi:hypothetical protein